MSDVTATANAIRKFIFDNRKTILLMISAPPIVGEGKVQGGGVDAGVPIIVAFLFGLIFVLVFYFTTYDNKDFKNAVFTSIIHDIANVNITAGEIPVLSQSIAPTELTQLIPMTKHVMLTNLITNKLYLLPDGYTNVVENALFEPTNLASGTHSFNNDQALESPMASKDANGRGGGLSNTSRDHCTYTDKIVNPITGRLIDAHGKTAKMLLDESKSGRVKLPRQFLSTIKRAIISHGV